MMVQVCNCGVKAVVASDGAGGRATCLRCRGRAEVAAEAKAHPEGLYGVSRTVDAERQTGIRAVGDREAKAYVRQLLTSATTAEGHAKAVDVALANGMTRAEVSGLLTMHYQQVAEHTGRFELARDECRWIRAALVRLNDRKLAGPEPKACAHEMTALDTVEGGTFCLDCGGKPKAEAKADPYEAHRVRMLNEASGAADSPFGDPPVTLTDALRAAEERLSGARESAEEHEDLARQYRADVARLEQAIAEHGRKAGGA